MEEKTSIPTRIYVPRWMGISILVGFVVLALGVGFALYRTYAQPTLFAPKDQYGSLGSISDVKVTPGSDIGKIAEAVTAHMNKDTQNKLTIIFFYDGYGTQKEVLDAVAVLKEALNEVEPFKSLQDLVAYKILTTDGKKCHPEKNMLVCEPKLIESFKKFGVDHFKVVILSPDYFTSTAPIARGANTFMTLSTFNNTLTPQNEKRWLGIVFTHLLGNSLGLKDEVVDVKDVKPQQLPPAGTTLKTLPSGKPNCALDMETAQKWWGGYAALFPKVSYNPGCNNNPNSYYPEKNTLMSDFPQKQSYGMVSEDYLRGVLSCFYGGKEAIIFPAGFTATYSASLRSCDTFTKDYPSFWTE